MTTAALILKNFQERVPITFINERTPFYFISTAFLGITIVLSILSAFHLKDNYSDFFPTAGEYYGKPIHDNTTVDKICWYFSQITHHTLVLLFFYFFLALMNCKSEPYFKTVSYTHLRAHET